MAWFSKKEEREVIIDDPVLRALLTTEQISSAMALEVPAVSGCVELISNTVASIPIKLYKEADGSTDEIKSDNRLTLLNDETGDLLDAYQMKKALARDYLLNGNGYIYINKQMNQVKSLHYVDEMYVSVTDYIDHIFKKSTIMIDGKEVRDFELIKVTKNTKNGITGTGIVQENQKILSVAYNSLIFEDNISKSGGNRKGFILSKSKLSEAAITALKNAWNSLYKNNSENVAILNEGLEFKESSNTSAEMQMNENKQTNSDEICKIFNMSTKVLSGTATDAELATFVKVCIMPILKAIETALNKDLLLETEKGSFYFAFDCKGLLKGDIQKMFNAYKIAVEANIMGIDEVRYELDLKPLGFEYIKLGLNDVLLNPSTKEVYTPNTNATVNLNNLKGGEASV